MGMASGGGSDDGELYDEAMEEQSDEDVVRSRVEQACTYKARGGAGCRVFPVAARRVCGQAERKKKEGFACQEILAVDDTVMGRPPCQGGSESVRPERSLPRACGKGKDSLVAFGGTGRGCGCPRQQYCPLAPPPWCLLGTNEVLPPFPPGPVPTPTADPVPSSRRHTAGHRQGLAHIGAGGEGGACMLTLLPRTVRKPFLGVKSAGAGRPFVFVTRSGRGKPIGAARRPSRRLSAGRIAFARVPSKH